MAQVRMYVQKGCPNCETAKQFFEQQGISVEAVVIGFDPILKEGIRVAGNGVMLPVPIIISFLTEEVAIGNDPAQLQHLVNGIRGTVASNSAS